MINNKTKGFTLIELLVVISIIGMLASVVLASVNSARDRARDAAVRSGVQEMRKLIELSALSTGTYTIWHAKWASTDADCDDVFFTNKGANVVEVCRGIIKNSTGTNRLHIGVNVLGVPSFPSATNFSIMGFLPGKQRYYCVGSSGKNSDVATYGQWTNEGCYSNP